jgi:dGTPase
MMDWNRLLSRKRLGTDDSNPRAGRPDYQRDSDKIVFSSAFRRLQDKMQVHGSAGIRARNRLTHSLETSRIGRSLGMQAGDFLAQRSLLPDGFSPSDIADTVEAGCLAHDIGSTPWGHAGEATLQDWFRTNPVGQRLLEPLTEAERADFLRFEGNAQGFRLITRGPSGRTGDGLKLTFTTLAGIVKYPRPAHLALGYGTERASARKSNFFLGDRELYARVAEELGLVELASDCWVRHPLAFLVEAADSMTYLIVDIEDAWHMGFLAYDEAVSMYRLLLSPGQHARRDTIKRVRGPEDREYNITTLRGRCLSLLVEQTVEAFVQNHASMLEGSFDRELVDVIPAAAAVQDLAHQSRDRIYNHADRMEALIGGHDALVGILDALGVAILEHGQQGRIAGMRTRSRYVLRAHPGLIVDGDGAYARVLRLTDHVAALTDDGARSRSAIVAGASLQAQPAASGVWNADYHS